MGDQPFTPGLLFQQFIVSQLVGALLGAAIAPGGLTPEEYAVQSAIGVADGITPTALAEFTGMPPSTLSRHIRNLTARGQLEREPDPRDARSYHLHLTPAGRRTYTENGRALVALIDRIDHHLPAGKEPVLDALRSFEQALRAVQAEEGTGTARALSTRDAS